MRVIYEFALDMVSVMHDIVVLGGHTFVTVVYLLHQVVES
jgi:hypothetical protein